MIHFFLQGKSLVQVVSKAHDFNKLFLLDDNSVFSIPTSHEYHMAVMTHALEDLSQPVQPPLPVQGMLLTHILNS